MEFSSSYKFDNLKNKCRLCLDLVTAEHDQVELTDEVDKNIRDFIRFEVKTFVKLSPKIFFNFLFSILRFSRAIAVQASSVILAVKTSMDTSNSGPT